LIPSEAYDLRDFRASRSPSSRLSRRCRHAVRERTEPGAFAASAAVAVRRRVAVFLFVPCRHRSHPSGVGFNPAAAAAAAAGV
ncbi:hypothetical protein BHM03_00054449, partial [Ensete ventricosum]